MVDFVQIYYKEDQLSQLYPFARPYYNDGLTIFFECDVIARVIPTMTAEKVAVCSWKLGRKMRRAWPITPETLQKDYDVLSFTRNSHRHQMLAMAREWHPDFMKAITLLWEKVGMKMPGEARNPIYQNAFAAKAEIYKRYVKDFLQPAIDVITTDEQLHELMIKPSKYGTLQRDADLKSVQAKLGMTDYPLCPFVLERCPSLFLTLHKIPVTYL